MPSVDELLSSATRRTGGGKCWAFYLDPPAAAYLQQVRDYEIANPGHVNRAEVARQLNKWFAVRVGVSSVKKHVSGDCTCD